MRSLVPSSTLTVLLSFSTLFSTSQVPIYNSFPSASAVIYLDFDGQTVAGTSWTKGFLAEVGHYVFSKLNCQRITVITEQPKVVRIAERLGGNVEGLLRNQFGEGRDGYIVGILRNEWKF